MLGYRGIRMFGYRGIRMFGLSRYLGCSVIEVFRIFGYRKFRFDNRTFGYRGTTVLGSVYSTSKNLGLNTILSSL